MIPFSGRTKNNAETDEEEEINEFENESDVNTDEEIFQLTVGVLSVLQRAEICSINPKLSS